jgi:hypothetical protein
MKLIPWATKTVKKRSRRSPEEKIKAQKRKVDAMLGKEWLKMLKSNPELVQQLAAAKFGLRSMNEGQDGAEYDAKDDLVSRMREVKELKEVFDELGGEDKQEPIGHLVVRTLLEHFPQTTEILKTITTAPPQEPAPTPIVTRTQAVPSPEEVKRQQVAAQEAAITQMVVRLFALNPKEAAQELWNHRSDANDVRSICVDYMLSQEFDALCGLVELVVKEPSYRFLRFQAQELTGSRRIWFEDLYNAIHALSEDEAGPVEPESQPYPEVELVAGGEEQPSMLEA